MSFVPISDGNAVPPLLDKRGEPIGVPLREWLRKVANNHARAIVALGLGHNTAQPKYGTTITPDLSQGAVQVITATNGTAFTIAAPINITQLEIWHLVIWNKSGGALGAVTFNSAIHQGGFAAPGNGLQTSVIFRIQPGSPPAHYQVGTWSPAL